MPDFADYANFGQGFGWTGNELCIAYEKKAYVRLALDYDALDVANKIGII